MPLNFSVIVNRLNVFASNNIVDKFRLIYDSHCVLVLRNYILSFPDNVELKNKKCLVQNMFPYFVIY